MSEKRNNVLAVLKGMAEGTISEYKDGGENKLNLADVNKVVYGEYNNKTTLNNPFVGDKYTGYATDHGFLVVCSYEDYTESGIMIKLFKDKDEIKDFLVNDVKFLNSTGLIEGSVAESLHTVNLIDKSYDDSFSIVKVVDELLDLRAKKVKNI